MTTFLIVLAWIVGYFTLGYASAAVAARGVWARYPTNKTTHGDASAWPVIVALFWPFCLPMELAFGLSHKYDPAVKAAALQDRARAVALRERENAALERSLDLERARDQRAFDTKVKEALHD